jgi:hypothetical protein
MIRILSKVENEKHLTRHGVYDKLYDNHTGDSPADPQRKLRPQLSPSTASVWMEFLFPIRCRMNDKD